MRDPESRGGVARAGHDRGFVDRLHDAIAQDERPPTIVSRTAALDQPEEEVAGKVASRPSASAGRSARIARSARSPAATRGACSSPSKRSAREACAPTSRAIASMAEPVLRLGVTEEVGLRFGDHVRADSVGPERDARAARRREADGVVHVGARVRRNPRAGARELVARGRVEVHGVRRDGPRRASPRRVRRAASEVPRFAASVTSLPSSATCT